MSCDVTHHIGYPTPQHRNLTCPWIYANCFVETKIEGPRTWSHSAYSQISPGWLYERLKFPSSWITLGHGFGSWTGSGICTIYAPTLYRCCIEMSHLILITSHCCCPCPSFCLNHDESPSYRFLHPSLSLVCHPVCSMFQTQERRHLTTLGMISPHHFEDHTVPDVPYGFSRWWVPFHHLISA